MRRRRHPSSPLTLAVIAFVALTISSAVKWFEVMHYGAPVAVVTLFFAPIDCVFALMIFLGARRWWAIRRATTVNTRGFAVLSPSCPATHNQPPARTAAAI